MFRVEVRWVVRDRGVYVRGDGIEFFCRGNFMWKFRWEER